MDISQVEVRALFLKQQELEHLLCIQLLFQVVQFNVALVLAHQAIQQMPQMPHLMFGVSLLQVLALLVERIQ